MHIAYALEKSRVSGVNGGDSLTLARAGRVQRAARGKPRQCRRDEPDRVTARRVGRVTGRRRSSPVSAGDDVAMSGWRGRRSGAWTMPGWPSVAGEAVGRMGGGKKTHVAGGRG
jgi:hypothetical protein